MFSIQLSEQFLCQVVVGAIHGLETFVVLAIASLFFMIFLQNFPKQWKNKKVLRAYLLLVIFLYGIYLVAYCLPSRSYETRQRLFAPEQRGRKVATHM